ncbi:hypothetical protein IPP75_01065 [Candidatus Saccharibacteria bacterium]|nr:MAG: hypothetical protein IPP75_01065 [Candidatus Saccharibacteria bacterium]
MGYYWEGQTFASHTSRTSGLPYGVISNSILRGSYVVYPRADNNDVNSHFDYRICYTKPVAPLIDYYGYTASGDSPDFITDISGNVTEKYLTLPGDVLVTIRPSRQSAGALTYSLPNIHGDIFATVDADGKILGTYQTGPFGEKLPIAQTGQVAGQTTTQWNTLNGASFAYVGQHEKLNEVALATAPVQMGARVYIPGLGRFLSVDPMPGGTPNLYAYTSDPVNEFDLDGNWPSFKSVVKWTTRIAVVASFVPGPIGMIGSGVAAAGYAYQGQKGKAAAALVGFIPGGKLISKVASKSGMASKLMTKVLTAQAKAKGIGTNSKLFGTHGQGILNSGRYRIGWSKDQSFVAWRIGQPGKHNHFMNLRTSIKWRGYR